MSEVPSPASHTKKQMRERNIAAGVSAAVAKQRVCRLNAVKHASKSIVVRLAPAVLAACALLACTNVGHAAGDATKGAAVFERQCALCHTIAKGAPNRFGPNLFGITERKAGTAPGYAYSPEFITMANWTWSPDGIASFVVAPALTIPGNKMSPFPGVAERDLDDLIGYLATQK